MSHSTVSSSVSTVHSSVSTVHSSVPARPGLGVAYYNEYLPDPSRLDEDLALMVAAGIRTIRVGESVWSTWEPRDGEFDTDWMTPILDGAERHGISVILGTPTYAAPPWLAKKHPELAVVRADGTQVPWGGRQEIDYTSPVFLHYAERVVRAVIGAHGRHPAVTGVQLDNEAGLHLIHNPHTVAAFRAWIAERYETPERLNEEWGLTYWSHRIASFDELWAPSGNTTPAYALAWRRFQAEQTTAFIAWQAAIVRPLIESHTLVTTCIAYGRPAMDDVAVGGVLDVPSGNAYCLMQDALDLRVDGRHDAWYADDVAGLVFMADRMRGTTDGPYLVTETGAASIGAAHQTRPPYAGQLAQVGWLLVARGARLVSYWHWHSLHSGHEVHWGGILPHDLRPGRVYSEIAAFGAELDAAGPWLEHAEAEADVALVIAHDSEWVMANEPPLARADGSADAWSYWRIVQTFARGIIDAGRAIGVVPERHLPDAKDLLARYDTAVVPGLIAASDRTLSVLADYVRLGGRLVIGPRTGFGDDEARIRSTVAPGALREVLGISYAEFTALAGSVLLTSGGVATGWIDAYVPEGATVRVGYAHPHHGAWAAVTEHAYGDGVATAVGTLPDRATLREVFVRAVAPQRTPPPVVLGDVHTAHSLLGPRGRVWVVHNWSGDTTTLPLTRPVTDVVTGEASATSITLPPWGVVALA